MDDDKGNSREYFTEYRFGSGRDSRHGTLTPDATNSRFPPSDKLTGEVRVKVLFFGMLKDVVGRAEDRLDLEDGATLGGVFEHYGSRFPRVREMAGSILLAR